MQSHCIPPVFISGLSQLSAEGAKQRTTRYAGARQRLYQKNHLSRIMELFRLPKYKKRKVIFNMANQYNSLSHTKWMCKYHIVFTPKYRRKIIYNQLKTDIRDILKQLCSYKGVGLNEATIKKYIQDQEKYDVMQDKLSVKEYEDPFKG